MTVAKLFHKYLENQVELERKLRDIELKVDHILFRLREIDPRVPNSPLNEREEFDKDMPEI